ncbi:putative nucleotidyltransferase with HDIG domain [Kineothrix alysoides]|uniref:Putative nucleotidyltransferase with HDIG domain n=1 Tax=Kineothrix alysoides TaxID=1469948 RepID=A0A4R1R5P2_9FIRM|nr:HDIG domain-containing metalloprotein [Kineothrix alysoides]TCL60612.1 putative nucleotidyltransferase with HDIG domain [Kineothrix alysoides]
MEMRSELFNTITEHLMSNEKPSDYLNQLYDSEGFKQWPFSMLGRLKDTEQSKTHHPEGNVWNHTMLVLDEAAAVKENSSDPKAFMWAALLHDIGKPDTTRIKGEKITSYNHDNVGADLSREFLEAVTSEQDFIVKVCLLVKYHMHMLYILKDLPFSDKEGLISNVDINDIALLGYCDRLGRKAANRNKVMEEYRRFYSMLETMKKEYRK